MISNHIQKIRISDTADMFIHDINIKDKTITYSMRDEMGQKIKPKSTSKFLVDENGTIHFDKRFIPVDFFEHLVEQRSS